LSAIWWTTDFFYRSACVGITHSSQTRWEKQVDRFPCPGSFRQPAKSSSNPVDAGNISPRRPEQDRYWNFNVCLDEITIIAETLTTPELLHKLRPEAADSDPNSPFHHKGGISTASPGRAAKRFCELAL
jgi:hypothetical protein